MKVNEILKYGILENGVWFINYEILNNSKSIKLSEHLGRIIELANRNETYYVIKDKRMNFNTFEVFYDKNKEIRGITKNTVIAFNEVGDKLADLESIKLIVLEV